MTVRELNGRPSSGFAPAPSAGIGDNGVWVDHSEIQAVAEDGITNGSPGLGVAAASYPPFNRASVPDVSELEQWSHL